MQLALRPYVSAAGVAVIGAGLIQVTPVAGPQIEQRAVQLAAAGDILDLLGPVDAAVNGLGGLGGELGGMMPTLSDVSGTFADAASSLTDLELLDPVFWQNFWAELINPDAGSSAWLMLTGALEQLPVIGPLLVGLGVAEFLFVLLLGGIWSEISQLFGIEPYAAAAEDFGTGLQGVLDAAVPGVMDALPAGVSTALADVTPLFNDAVAVLDPATLVQDVSAALDPSVVLSALDLNPIADIGNAIASTVSDLSGMLTSLIP